MLSALLALSACRREQPSHPTPAAASEGAPAAQVDPQGRPILGGAPTNEAEAAAQRLAQAGGDRGEPKPVYPAVAQADPLADRLCEALHTVPARRRADCCEQKTTGYLVTADCVATLSAALAAEGLTLSESSVAACEKAMAEAHAGCGWVGPFPARVPAACDGVFVGALGAGERCRSALECAPGLACRGLAPTTVGVCAPPARRGRACQTGIDPLAALTRQEGTSAAHPECEGFCARHLCQDATPLGEPCQTNLQCGPNAHCEGGTCQPGAEAAEGAACIDGGCPRDTRCIDKICQKPKPEGAPCQSDAQCQGGCLKPPDATEGQCGTRCKAPFLP
ncbi:MAG: hypothetical protein R3F39_05090 [Myxococcota bacterium]